MRAIIVDAPGVKDNLRVGEAPQPIPGPGEALIDVAYCGCNFADTMIVSGTYAHPNGYPIIGGLEVSGPIAALGPGVTDAHVGDRVAACHVFTLHDIQSRFADVVSLEETIAYLCALDRN